MSRKNTDPNAPKEAIYNIRGRVIAGVLITGLLGAAVFGWAANSNLVSAVVVSGEVSVDRDLRVVQHRDGGIIKEIPVSAGDHVREGDTLFRLDDTSARSERTILHGKIAELAIRKSRLEAQRDLHEEFSMPTGLDELIVSPTALEVIYLGEHRIFQGNVSSFVSRKEQIHLGIEQVRTEIDGLEARLDAKQDEISLVQAESDRVEDLSERRLTARNVAFSIERENVRLRGEHGEILSALGRARSRISELELEILTMQETLRTDAQRELREIETQLSELNEKRFVIEDTLSRTEIRAPISGLINDLNINSIGGVISPAEILATIVPEDAELVFTARVPAVSIEQVDMGYAARMRFVAFDQNETPEIEGTVAYVAAAATSDPQMPGDFYSIKVDVTPEQLARLGGQELRPGMPVEVYVTTAERTALSYLVKPFSDQFARAFKER
ncbi:HlyD family type I secretion periplasmic adaptor subunit [Thalassobacter stenotrophicus]|uniref:HlyD family type I secretion periplasmic adaptor subunit n=1 Tax=Thalassobacter stenotrophicus TaxID=266809 RepID=UPI0022A979B3|nr:HlyD family type I secretion periplasmic adaptor subunit [Thalassobacter stenotrophicus]UYP68406.1 HlyD family type I secretion periplasmic adaptor subunit [Thalassobacter stenotrophicus]